MRNFALIISLIIADLTVYYFILFNQSNNLNLTQAIIYTLLFVLFIFTTSNVLVVGKKRAINTYFRNKIKRFIIIYLVLLLYIIIPLRPNLGSAIEELMFFSAVPISFLFVTLSFLMLQFLFNNNSNTPH